MVARWVPRDGKYSYVQPGWILPINASASAKAIFAFQDKSLIDDVLSTPLVRYRAKTKVSKSSVKNELDFVRRDGFAVCNDEFDPGVLSYACPVHLTGFGTLYSIGIVGLSERFGHHPIGNIVAALRKRADALSLALYSHVKGPDVGIAESKGASNGAKQKSGTRRRSVKGKQSKKSQRSGAKLPIIVSRSV
jgi:DNA-binding IclR family transcriptional regulator